MSDTRKKLFPGLSGLKPPKKTPNLCAPETKFLPVVSHQKDPNVCASGCQCTIHVRKNFALACDFCGFVSLDTNGNVNVNAFVNVHCLIE